MTKIKLTRKGCKTKFIEESNIIDGKIVSYHAIKTATATGDGAHILLPKDLIGKEVTVMFTDKLREEKK